MKKFLLSLLVIILALGLLGAVGVAGYRTGFTQGMIVASARNSTGNGNGTGNVQPRGPGYGMMQRGAPMYNFGFNRGFDRDGFGMMQRGRGGFGIFRLFGFLVWLLFLGLIVAGIVWLVNRSGWRLTRTATAAASPAATTTVVETPPTAGPTTTVVETPPPASSDEENRAP